MKKSLTKGQAIKVLEIHAPHLLDEAEKIYTNSKPKKEFIANLKNSISCENTLNYIELSEDALNFKSQECTNITFPKFKTAYKDSYEKDEVEKIIKFYSSLLANKSNDIVQFVFESPLLQTYINMEKLNELLMHGDRVKQLTPFMSDTVANSILGKLDDNNITLDEALDDPFLFTKTRFLELTHKGEKPNFVDILSNEQADALSLVKKDDYYRFYNTFIYTLHKVTKDTVSTYAIGYKDNPRKFNSKTKKYEKDDEFLVLNQTQAKINRNCDKLLSKKININNYKSLWLNRMKNEGVIQFYDNKYFFIDDFEAEYELEQLVRKFIKNTKIITKEEVPAGFVVDGQVTNDEGFQITLSNEQLLTAKKVSAMKSGLAIITGRAGSGKTTVTEKILKIRHDLGLLGTDPTEAIFCAPMGIASKRLGQALGKNEATTIHAAVNLPYVSKAKLVVIDETGFADMHILLLFFKVTGSYSHWCPKSLVTKFAGSYSHWCPKSLVLKVPDS